MKDSIENNGLLSEGYGIAPRKLAIDKKLSDGAYRLWTLLSCYARGGNGCFPLQETLADDLGKRPETICVLIKELEDIGYINKSNRDNNGRALKYTLNFIYSEEVKKELPKATGDSPLLQQTKKYIKKRKEKNIDRSKKLKETRIEAKRLLTNFYSQFDDKFKINYEVCIENAKFVRTGIDVARFSTKALEEFEKSAIVSGIEQYQASMERGTLRRVRNPQMQLYRFIENMSTRCKPKETARELTKKTLIKPMIQPAKIRGEKEENTYIPFEQRYLFMCLGCRAINIEGHTEKCPTCKKYLDWENIIGLTEEMKEEQKESLEKQKKSFGWGK